MNAFMLFWTIAYILGFGTFAGMALFIIPAGARDLVQLLRELKKDDDKP